MLIVGLTVFLAWVLQAPVEGNWFLAILIPLEVVYAVIFWLAMAQELIQMTAQERRNVGWGTRVFFPEAILFCLLMVVKEEGPEFAEALWERWNGWLENLPRVTYLRASCAVAAALIGFCLPPAIYVLFMPGVFTDVPTEFVIFVGITTLLSLVTTTRGNLLGLAFALWLLGIGFYISQGLAGAAVVPFSATFIAEFLGWFIVEEMWNKDETTYPA